MDTREIEKLRAAVIKQADLAGPDGWMEIPVGKIVSDSRKLRVPRGAFEHWAVRPSGAEHLAAPWQAVSPQGIKQGADDPYHTDWMLGAGLNPKDMRHDSPNMALSEALTEAAYAARAKVEKRLLDFDCSVLLSGPDIIGRAWHPSSPDDLSIPYSDEPPVAILRDARPDWLPIVMDVLGKGGAVIVERGGEMAHLVNEARGTGFGPIVRRAKALQLYPDNLLVKVSPSDGRIEIQDDWRMPTRTAASLIDNFRGDIDPEPDPQPHEDDKRFNLVRMDGKNPADDCPYMWMDKSSKVEGVNYDAYGTVFSTDYEGNNCHLAIRVFGRREASGFRANYYAGTGKWPFKDVQRAARQALDQFERRPSIEEIIAKDRAAKQARADKFKDKLRAMSDDDLLAYAKEKAEDERKYYDEVEKGKWDLQDQWDIERDYREFFWHVGDELIARGLPEVEREPHPSLSKPLTP
jgi:hypothetical protein